MEVEFADDQLERLESDADFNAGYGLEVVRGFRKVMRFIRSAEDERDFRNMRSLRFERLKGDRDHQHSIRINRQWRLIVELRQCSPKNVVVVQDIEDYH